MEPTDTKEIGKLVKEVIALAKGDDREACAVLMEAIMLTLILSRMPKQGAMLWAEFCFAACPWDADFLKRYGLSWDDLTPSTFKKEEAAPPAAAPAKESDPLMEEYKRLLAQLNPAEKGN